MLIKSITLENFKGIQEQTRIELKPITLLFGANSAGKSTILQALLYAREILERHNLDPDKTLLGGDVLDLGGFKNLVNQHDLSKEIKIGFEVDVENQDLPSYLSESEYHFLDRYYDNEVETWLSSINTIAFELSIKWNKLTTSPFVNSIKVFINEVAIQPDNTDRQLLLSVMSMGDGNSVVVESFDIDHSIFQTYDDELEEHTSELAILWDDALAVSLGKDAEPIIVMGVETFPALYINNQSDALPIKSKLLSIDRSAFRTGEDKIVENLLVTENFITSLLSSLLVGPIDLVREELEKLIYIGPLRDIPSRSFNYSRSPDSSEWANGSAAWNILNKAPETFIENVNNWLDNDANKLNSGYTINIKKYRELPIYHPVTVAITSSLADTDMDDLRSQLELLPIKTQLLIKETASNLDVHPYDIGVGISQLLPVIVAALYQRSGILSVEQPELHIHPRLQVALGDLFASQVNNEDIDTIYLLETHSEHLMLRLLRRIRETSEGDLPPDAPSLTPDDVAVLYIENNIEGMKITNLAIDEEGDFDDQWPKGFFEERAGELF